jgi:hypothetical protein
VIKKKTKSLGLSVAATSKHHVDVVSAVGN